MDIDFAAVEAGLVAAQAYRQQILAQLEAAEVAANDPALEENAALHRSTFVERMDEVRRLERELEFATDEMNEFSLILNGGSDTSDPMDVHESPYTTGYYSNN